MTNYHVLGNVLKQLPASARAPGGRRPVVARVVLLGIAFSPVLYLQPFTLPHHAFLSLPPPLSLCVCMRVCGCVSLRECVLPPKFPFLPFAF